MEVTLEVCWEPSFRLDTHFTARRRNWQRLGTARGAVRRSTTEGGVCLMVREWRSDHARSLGRWIRSKLLLSRHELLDNLGHALRRAALTLPARGGIRG